MIEIKITKFCPLCGKEMVLRRKRSTQEEFLGCKGWPNCRHTEPIPEVVKMWRLGAPTLF